MPVDGALPGADLAAAGLQDLRRGAMTVEALLILPAKPAEPWPVSRFLLPELHPVWPISSYTGSSRARIPGKRMPAYSSLLQRLVSFACTLERTAGARPSGAG